MSIETELYSYLTGLTGTDQIGDLVGTRIYPIEFPQAADPDDELDSQIVYDILTRTRDRSQDGETGLVNMRMRFDCRAGTYAAARAMETAMLAAFWKMKNRYVGSIWVQSAEIQDASDDDTPAAFSDEQGLFHALIDLDLWYEEPTPAMIA